MTEYAAPPCTLLHTSGLFVLVAVRCTSSHRSRPWATPLTTSLKYIPKVLAGVSLSELRKHREVVTGLGLQI